MYFYDDTTNYYLKRINMKIKFTLFIALIAFLQFGCKKDTTTNTFKFISISGRITPGSTTGAVSFIWSDNKNSNWNVVVRNSNGSVRNNVIIKNRENTVSGLGLDSTYVFGVSGATDSSQNGSFNARIATTGDVMINDIKP